MLAEKLFGLIGRPLGHSQSAAYFARKFEQLGLVGVCDYRLFELGAINELHRLLADNPNIVGLNVTIPYKTAVIPLLDRLSAEAERIGAVNCIRREADGTLTGYNTDYIGFGRSLTALLGGDKPTGALVLGTGGASRAVCTWLNDNGIAYKRVSHSGVGELSYEEVTPEVVGAHKLIVNTTPLGMSPRCAEAPELPYQALTADHYLFDLVYNPAVTEFMRRGAQQGAKVCGGQAMFEGQAEASWKIWG